MAGRGPCAGGDDSTQRQAPEPARQSGIADISTNKPISDSEDDFAIGGSSGAPLDSGGLPITDSISGPPVLCQPRFATPCPSKDSLMFVHNVVPCQRCRVKVALRSQACVSHAVLSVGSVQFSFLGLLAWMTRQVWYRIRCGWSNENENETRA